VVIEANGDGKTAMTPAIFNAVRLLDSYTEWGAAPKTVTTIVRAHKPEFRN
jgi:hypothetical protein